MVEHQETTVIIQTIELKKIALGQGSAGRQHLIAGLFNWSWALK